MKQTIYNFPKFQAGQILTSEFLNNAFGYTEEQSRLTRSLLLGDGIIEGLQYSYGKNSKNKATLTIRSGTAITSDGYHLHLKKDTQYTQAVKFVQEKSMATVTPPLYADSSPNVPNEMYLLFSNTESLYAKNNGTVENIPDLSDYVVALVAEFKPTDEEIKCSEVTCDIGKINYIITPRPVLIKASYFTKPLRAKFSPLNGHVQLERFVGISNAINVNTLTKKTKALFDTNKGMVLDLAKSIDDLCENKAWHKVLDNDRRATQRFHNTLQRIQDLCYGYTEIPDYYLWHLHDLGEAMNEFVDNYNEFSTKYPCISINRHKYDQFVLLGKGESYKNNEYRQTYQSVNDDKDFIVSCKVLRRLFYRIIVMSKCFIRENMDRSRLLQFKITMQNPELPLSERPIPYYYRNTQKLQSLWAAPMLAQKCRLNDYDKLPTQITHPANGANCTLLMQGYYGKDVNMVKEQLEKYIADNDLNIQIESIDMNKTAIKKQHLSTLKKDIFDANGITQIQDTKNKIQEGINKPEIIHITIPVFSGKTEGQFKVKLEEIALSAFSEETQMMMHVKPRSEKVYRVLAKTIINGKEKFIAKTIDKELTLDDTTPKKIQKQQLTIIKRNPFLKNDPFLKIANALLNFGKTNIITSIDNGEILSPDIIEKGNNLLSNISDKTLLLNFIKMAFYNKAPNYTRAPYSEKHVAAIFALKSFLEKQHDSNIRFAEFIEGSRNGSTLVLLHYHGRLIKIACIPTKKE